MSQIVRDGKVPNGTPVTIEYETGLNVGAVKDGTEVFMGKLEI